MVFSPPAEPTFTGMEIHLDLDMDTEEFYPTVPLRRVPGGDIFEAARAGDCARLALLLEAGANVNARDRWDSVPLYYACLAGHPDAARMLLQAGAVCAESTFDGDRCHYAALNLDLRRLLKSFEARPPPLPPLPAALRAAFLACPANRAAFLDMMLQGAATAEAAALAQAAGFAPTDDASMARLVPPDITFYVGGKPIEAHRVILCARSPFFEKKFKTDWKDRKEVRFSEKKLSFTALYNLVHFFYADRLEAPVEDMESLSLICKVCKCEELRMLVDGEIVHHANAQYKAAKKLDHLVESQIRFVLQGQSLPLEDRLPSALQRVLHNCLANSRQEDYYSCNVPSDVRRHSEDDDGADLIVKVDDRVFRCHRVILASRSEYFKARISRTVGFREAIHGSLDLPTLEAHDMSVEAFEKMLEYMYTDKLQHMDPILAEELFDVASRYLLFPLKRVVADLLLPELEHVSPAELCHWLMLSDIYGVVKIREYCLDIIACNFETFADTREFRALLLTLPPPSAQDALRTTRPNAPGAMGSTDQGNVLDDLRDKWLEAEAAELDERDQSAALFDKRLEQLMFVAEREADDDHA